MPTVWSRASSCDQTNSAIERSAERLRSRRIGLPVLGDVERIEMSMMERERRLALLDPAAFLNGVDGGHLRWSTHDVDRGSVSGDELVTRVAMEQ